MPRTLFCLGLVGSLLAGGCAERAITEIRVFGPTSSQAVEQTVAAVARDAGFDSDGVTEWTSISTDEVRVFVKERGSPACGYQGLKGETSRLVVEYYRGLRRVKIKSYWDTRSRFFRAVRQDIHCRLLKLEGVQIYTLTYFEFPE